MLISEKLLYLELPKTACSHIRDLLKFLIGGELVGKHNRPPNKLIQQNKHIIGSIRSPWDWYLSLWSFGCDAKGVLYKRLTSRQLRGYGLTNNLKIISWSSVTSFLLENIFKPIKTWQRLYSDSHNPELFREWLYYILDLNSMKKYSFAVPFFLASSFYFMTRKRKIHFSVDFWRSRFERIVIPYVIWSAVYLILRVIFLSISNQSDRLSNFLQDPLSIVFFGGSSYHLYFIPLLLVGTSLILFSDYFASRQFKLRLLILFSIASIILNQIIIVSGNAFNLSQYLAFNELWNITSLSIENHPIARIILVYVAWLLRCLPYFFIAIILNRLYLEKGWIWFSKSSTAIFSIIVFIFANVLGNISIFKAAINPVMAYSLLIFGISLSKNIDENNWLIYNLGNCSFGIYLIHPIIMNFIKPFLIKFGGSLTDSVTIVSMLLISIISFLSSWMLVSCMMKSKKISKYIFGV